MDAAPGLALGTEHSLQGQPRAACKLLQQGPSHLPHLQHPSSPCLLSQTLYSALAQTPELSTEVRMSLLMAVPQNRDIAITSSLHFASA